MDFLTKGYSALLGEKGQPQTITDTLDKLVDRFKNSQMLEDRRVAALGLRKLAREYQLEVGSKCTGLLLNTLKSNDMADPEMAYSVLQCLDDLCSKSGNSALDNHTNNNQYHNNGEQPEDVSLQFSEMVIKDKEAIAALLNLLEQHDFYMRHYTIGYLRTLVENSASRLQEAILVAPNGISLLVDLLDDNREAVRNDGLLLLISLTQSNADIQKIIAFENAFERITEIIFQEGATDGDIVVQDCLQLMINLLRYNISNQNYFRETSCLSRLVHLFDISNRQPMVPNDASSSPVANSAEREVLWTGQKMENMCIALNLIRILVAPESPTTEYNQTVLYQSQVLSRIVAVARDPKTPDRIKSHAYYAVADMVRGHGKNQKFLEEANLVVKTLAAQVAGGDSASSGVGGFIVGVLECALEKNEYFPLRTSCAYLFECYLFNNPNGQVAIASTFTAPPSPDNAAHASPGSLILSGVTDWSQGKKDPYSTFFACYLLSLVLWQNPTAKQLAIKHKIELDVYGEKVVNNLLFVVFAQLMAVSRELTSSAASTGSNLSLLAIAYLQLLTVWCESCPEAVFHAFQNGSHLTFIIEQIVKSSGSGPGNSIVFIQGLSALLLGFLYEFNDDSVPSFSRASLHPIIVTRVGLDLFFNRMKRVKDSSEFSNSSRYLLTDEEWHAWERSFSAASGASSVKQPPINLIFDQKYVDFFKDGYELLHRSIVRKGPTKAAAQSNSPATNSASNNHQISGRGVNASSPNPATGNNTLSAAASTPTVQPSPVVLAGPSPEVLEQISKLKEALSRAEAEAGSWKTKCQDLESKLASEREANTALKAQFEEKNNALVDLEKEQEDLLVCLAEQDLEMKKLRDRLKAHGEVIEEDEVEV